VGAPQDQERHQVRHRAQDGGKKHDVRLHLRRGTDPPDRLGKNDYGNHDQDQCVGQGREDFGPLVPVGPLVACRLACYPGGQQCDGHAGGVRKHVAGVGKQGQ
jgi:hypothetical protein